MAYKITKTKEEAFKQLEALIHAYYNGRTSFLQPGYKETPLRNDFVDPFLKCFGWDVDNEELKTQFQRDVLQEETIEIQDDSVRKNPDYTLRVNGLRKFFVEAKKPSVNIETSKKAAFQVRRYGWNANLGISIITNFEQLIIYDCRHKPSPADDPHIARVRVFNCDEYLSAFDELYYILSYESVNSGVLDNEFKPDLYPGQTFDDYFLSQIETWRQRLADSAIKRNSKMTEIEINFLIQRLLNRIIFLRICEDREIEKYQTLRSIEDYDGLKQLFNNADKKYNSGLFDFIEDDISLNIDLDADVIIGVFNELYYPLSPYDFNVVDAAILSQIYEKFLGSRIGLDNTQKVLLLEEPEVVASNGVVPTPKLIVEKIVRDTLSPLTASKSQEELLNLKIADICCGSGTFLLSAFDFLLKSFVEKSQNENSFIPELHLKLANGEIGLTIHAKRLILEKCLFGVDINPYAVEVTKFSLLLKLLEGESKNSVDYFISEFKSQVLPDISENIKCGNSLVDDRFFTFMPEAEQNDSLILKIRPFNWIEEFPFLQMTGGFDTILGNPPYVRIQNLVKFSPEEVKFYQSPEASYSVAQEKSIDKYFVFIQRALELLNSSGYLGYIVPNKFFITTGGKSLRQLLRSKSSAVRITHFGVTQVFPNRSTYTVILVLKKEKSKTFEFTRVNELTPYLLSENYEYVEYDAATLENDPWVFLPKATRAIFEKINSSNVIPLGELSKISVGVQTSCDEVFIFTPDSENHNNYQFKKEGKIWEIEKEICQPCILDLPFKMFESIMPNAYMIFPYYINGEKAEVFSEDYMVENFPLCMKYLNANKEKLIRRSINGKSPLWYQFGRTQSLTVFQEQRKLLWHVLSTKPTYVIDNSSSLFTGGGNGPYYSLLTNSKYPLEYFLGILVHPVFENMVKSRASEFRGAYYSHGKQFLEKLPIYAINFEDPHEVAKMEMIVELVKQIIHARKSASDSIGADRQTFYRQYTRLTRRLVIIINNLYNLTDIEFHTIMKDLRINESDGEEA